MARAEKQGRILMIPEFAIVTAVTPDYVKKLRWCLPTWILKPQFRNRKLYVFYHGFGNPEKDLSWIGEYFKDCECVQWEMPEYETIRELMLSSFVLGSAIKVKEEYFVKLDADTFFTDSMDVFFDKDFEYDLFSHSWGYTKPGWWIDALNEFVKNKPYKGDKKDTGRRGGKRIQSICCLHKTEFVRKCAQAAGSRLPVPSHDTYLWYMANHFPDCKWSSRKLYKHGVGHNSKWKNIRENICASECAWNDYLNGELLKNVQIHITDACNIGCNNCDRCCGVAPTNGYMDVASISKFLRDSSLSGHVFNRIDIIGGEPMLHPFLSDVLSEFESYKERHYRTKIRLTTNGTANVHMLDQLPKWLQVRNSAKEKGCKDYDFEAFNVAPIDSGHSRLDAKSCSIPWRCGFAVTRHGILLCGAGYGIARVFGFDIGIKSWKDLSIQGLRNQRAILCQYCGHSRSIAKRSQGQQISESWQKAIDRYTDENKICSSVS